MTLWTRICARSVSFTINVLICDSWPWMRWTVGYTVSFIIANKFEHISTKGRTLGCALKGIICWTTVISAHAGIKAPFYRSIVSRISNVDSWAIWCWNANFSLYRIQCYSSVLRAAANTLIDVVSFFTSVFCAAISVCIACIWTHMGCWVVENNIGFILTWW